MESTKFLTASLLAASLMAVGTTVSAALTDGLQGYYEFNTDFTTSAGTVDGVANNGATAGAAGGIAGNAMQVTPQGGGATSQYMSVALDFGGASALGDNFTISAWYNLQNPGSSQTGRHFVFENANDFDVSYGIRDSGQGAAGINDGQAFTQDEIGSDNIIIADAGVAGWHHVIQTYSSAGGVTTITTYVDGVDIGTLQANTASITGPEFNFGAARNSAANRGFDGLIDEAALWNRSLSAQEAGQVYQTGLAGNSLFNPVPEPGSLALLGLGGLLIARRRRG